MSRPEAPTSGVKTPGKSRAFTAGLKPRPSASEQFSEFFRRRVLLDVDHQIRNRLLHAIDSELDRHGRIPDGRPRIAANHMTRASRVHQRKREGKGRKD